VVASVGPSVSRSKSDFGVISHSVVRTAPAHIHPEKTIPEKDGRPVVSSTVVRVHPTESIVRTIRSSLVVLTVFVAGVAHASPPLVFGSALLAADVDENSPGEGAPASQPAAAADSTTEEADATPTPTEPAAPAVETKNWLRPTAKGAILGAVAGAILVGVAAFLIFPMFTPELEPLGIGGGEAYIVAMWSIAVGVPTGAILGSALGAGIGYGVAALEE